MKAEKSVCNYAEKKKKKKTGYFHICFSANKLKRMSVPESNQLHQPSVRLCKHVDILYVANLIEFLIGLMGTSVLLLSNRWSDNTLVVN